MEKVLRDPMILLDELVHAVKMAQLTNFAVTMPSDERRYKLIPEDPQLQKTSRCALSTLWLSAR